MNIRTSQRAIGLVVAFAVVVSILTACATPKPQVVEVEVTRIVAGTPETVIVTATPAPVEEPAEEAHDTLVVVSSATPPSLDPDWWAGNHWIRVVTNVYDSVMEYAYVAPSELGIEGATDVDGVSNVTGELDEGITGNFFESWTISEDKQTITLKIREGYKSYYGDQATADDFIWRVERAFATNDMGEFQIMVTGITTPTDITKIDDMTIQVHLPNGPNPVFFKGMCVQVVTPLDVDRLRDEGWLTAEDPWGLEAFKQHDFGFGPYHAVEWIPGQQVVLEANPYYYKPLHFKKVIVREVPEAGNRFAMLVSGEAHVTQELTLIQMNELRGGLGEARLVDLPTSTEAFRMVTNQDWGTFANSDCFHALGYAVPYEEIQRVAFLGFGQIKHVIVAPLVGPDVNTEYMPFHYDIDKARELWQKGNCPKTWTLSFCTESPHHEDVAILIRGEFAKLGVDVVIDKLPTATFYQKLAEHTMEALIMESSHFVADAGYALWLSWHKDSFGNEQGYYSDEVSAMIDQSMSMPAGPERTALLWEIQQIVTDEGGRFHMLYPGWHVAANRHLRGLYWPNDNYLKWKYLYWED